jgi:hypothetical protein
VKWVRTTINQKQEVLVDEEVSAFLTKQLRIQVKPHIRAECKNRLFSIDVASLNFRADYRKC